MNLQINKIYQGDCLNIMPNIEENSIDMIMCDLPYGTTACKWDAIIPFEAMWKNYERVCKSSAAIVLTASQPFTSALVMSNPKNFRHEWIWVKNTSSGMMLAGKAPMKRHESILVFSWKATIFNPQKLLGSETSQHHSKAGYKYKNKPSRLYNVEGGVEFEWSEMINPYSVLPCNSVGNRDKSKIHPTQKPVALFEYLIKTYSNPGDLVLDNCIGSGTTAIACIDTGRNWIGIESEQEYVDLANIRIAERLEKSNFNLKGFDYDNTEN